MLELLSRDPAPKEDNEESQVKGFTGAGLPAGSKLWSKAGWTSNTRHDAALVELPSGKRFILVTFTLNHATRTLPVTMGSLVYDPDRWADANASILFGAVPLLVVALALARFYLRGLQSAFTEE